MKGPIKAYSRYLVLALDLLLVSASNALANDCSRLELVIAFASTEVAPDGATCISFQSQSGNAGVTCYWEFQFRDEAALYQAGSLWSMLKRCRVGYQKDSDLQVNHPDSYVLREWVAGENTFSVSTKDKAGQQRTLVFLRIE